MTRPDDEGPVLESYQLASESKCAVLTRMKWHLDANTIGEYDACFLPLSENGRTVDKALGMECYENVERNFTLGRRQPSPRTQKPTDGRITGARPTASSGRASADEARVRKK